MASRNVDLVINGIKNLSAAERDELARILSAPGAILESQKNLRFESLSKSFRDVNAVSTSPVGHGSCACCGR